MRVFYLDHYHVPLPAGHRFPTHEYARSAPSGRPDWKILRERVR